MQERAIWIKNKRIQKQGLAGQSDGKTEVKSKGRKLSQEPHLLENDTLLVQEKLEAEELEKGKGKKERKPSDNSATTDDPEDEKTTEEKEKEQTAAKTRGGVR